MIKSCEYEDINKSDCINNGLPANDCNYYEEIERKKLRQMVHERAERIRKKEYNKAIDDAKSVILQTLDNEILVDTLHLRLEQLKAGETK